MTFTIDEWQESAKEKYKELSLDPLCSTNGHFQNRAGQNGRNQPLNPHLQTRKNFRPCSRQAAVSQFVRRHGVDGRSCV